MIVILRVQIADHRDRVGRVPQGAEQAVTERICAVVQHEQPCHAAEQGEHEQP